MDWSAHLAWSPGRRLHLADLALHDMMRLSGYAFGRAAGLANPPGTAARPQRRLVGAQRQRGRLHEQSAFGPDDLCAFAAHFDVLGHWSRDPNAYWKAFDLDLRCEEGGRLHCLEVFGRQLICALHGLHPRAVLTFADRRTSQAA